MLKQNDAARKLLHADVWHDAGYTGKGVTIALLDDGGDPRGIMKDYFVDMTGKSDIGHATNVGFSAHEFAPEVKVIGFRSNQESFEWINDHKDEIDLINVSQAGIIGGTTPYYLQYETLEIPLICASGNDDFEDKISYPAAYPFTIAIGAALKDGKTIAGYSNEGSMLDAVVPSGVYVQRDDGYAWSVSGTSFAAPTACGLLACYIQWRKENGLPKLKTEEARKFIHQNCVDIRDKGFDYDSGYGLFVLPEQIPVVPKEEPAVSTPYNRTIQAIVIHHMGDGRSPGESILGRWNPYDYDYPEYDYGIEADGTIRIGRPINIQGSHTISDKAPYSQKGYQWFNRNSIGIGLAGDFTLYDMPKAQFMALVDLVKRLMAEHKLTLDNVYPHGQVAYSDCPGCTYSKVPALTKGLWSYDEFEKAVLRPKEVEDVLDVAVLLFTKEDYWAGTDVAAKNGNCAMFVRKTDRSVPTDAMKAKKLFVIGGPTTGHPNEVLLSGNDKYDTAAAVKKYLG